MTGTGLYCYYCAQSQPPEGLPHNPKSPALVTIHDQRGCVAVCWEHASWRRTTSSAHGHSQDCSEHPARKNRIVVAETAISMLGGPEALRRVQASYPVACPYCPEGWHAPDVTGRIVCASGRKTFTWRVGEDPRMAR